jgi:hypothetical protein
MRRFLVRFIRPEAFAHTRSLVDFITNTSESRFSVHTAGSGLLCLGMMTAVGTLGSIAAAAARVPALTTLATAVPIANSI